MPNTLLESNLEVEDAVGMNSNTHYTRAVNVPYDDIKELRRSYLKQWIQDNSNVEKPKALSGRVLTEEGLAFYLIGKQRAREYTDKYYVGIPNPDNIVDKRTFYPKIKFQDIPKDVTIIDTLTKDMSTSGIKNFLEAFGVPNSGTRCTLQQRVDTLLQIIQSPNYLQENNITDRNKDPPPSKRQKQRKTAPKACRRCRLPKKDHVCAVVVLEIWKKKKEELQEAFPDYLSRNA